MSDDEVPTTDPAPDPTDLNDFEIGELLGEGGSATVHRAVHRTLNATVALKRLRHLPSEDERRKFLDECRLQWQLSSEPTIVRLFWAAAPPGERPWLAMELYDESLADRLAQQRPISSDQAVQWSRDLLRGLTAIHESGHLHRDVKPANLLIRDGRAALADLGIAMRSTTWTNNYSAGTARYLAPEVLRGDPPTYRSDVYSAALTIEHLFRGAVPSGLDPLIVRATSHNPADRPADAASFSRDFAAALVTGTDKPELRGTGDQPALSDPVIEPLPHRPPPDRAIGARYAASVVRHGGSRFRRIAKRRVALTVAILIAAGALSAMTLWPSRKSPPSASPAAQISSSRPTAGTTVGRTVSLDGCAPLSMSVPSGRNDVFVACQEPDGVDHRPIKMIDERTGTVVVLNDTALTLCASPDGKLLYAATDHHTIDVIDTATGTVRRSLPVDANPNRMAVSPTGKELYLTNSRHTQAGGFSQYVVRIDTSNGRLSYIRTGDEPSDVAYTSTGQYVLVTNRYDNSLSVIAVASHKVVRTIPVGHQPIRVAAFSLPGGTYAYVDNSADNTVSVIDIQTGTELFTTTKTRQASAVAVDPDRAGYSYIADAVGNDLVVISKGIDTQPATIRRILVGQQPMDVIVSSDGHLFVANFLDSTISILEAYRS